MPEAFADVIKAWLVLTDARSSHSNLGAQASRYLWSAIEEQDRGQDFEWQQLRNRDFECAEDMMVRAGLGASTIISFCGRLRALISWAQLNGIVSEAVTWKSSLRTIPIGSNAEERERRLDRLPNRRVLEALGEIYQEHAKAPRDRLIICALGLLLVGGFRIGELMTLAFDCIIVEQRRGRRCVGLRYWRRKTKRGELEASVRWLSPLGGELAEKCINELADVTAGARATAIMLERDEGAVPIPWATGKDVLTAEEAARALAVTVRRLGQLGREGTGYERRVVPLDASADPLEYCRSDVEKALLGRRSPLVAFQASNGFRQKLSETLLIEFDKNGSTAADSELLVRQLPVSSVSTFLGGAEQHTPSAFTRFGYNDLWKATGNDAERHNMRSHMARHWLNTVANKAGMTAFQITLWMQRAGEDETLRYLHDTREIADLTQIQILRGELDGLIPRIVAALPPSDREAAVQVIEYGHYVKTGICLDALENYACRRSKSCDTRCPSFAWKTNDARSIGEIERRRERALFALEVFDRREAKGERLQARQRELLVQQVDALTSMLVT